MGLKAQETAGNSLIGMGGHLLKPLIRVIRTLNLVRRPDL